MATTPKAPPKVPIKVPAIRLQETPPVYMAAIPGFWLVDHTTPSWRIKKPATGFQRIVKDVRARQIAYTVLDKGRAFPNAITLATNTKSFKYSAQHELTIPATAKLLVVDGQHRLWAQKSSKTEGQYACIIHLGKSEKEMAELFLEVNDTQTRVPSSLRWDLVRLVRPEKKEAAVMASELVYELATREDSPFYFAVDLTGEKKDVSIKQGSLAPEIETLVSRTKKKFEASFDDYIALLIRFFSAVKALNSDGWGDPESTYYKARVLRALIRVLTDLALESGKLDLSAADLLARLSKIKEETLTPAYIKAAQGTFGVQRLYDDIRAQVFAKGP